MHVSSLQKSSNEAQNEAVSHIIQLQALNQGRAMLSAQPESPK